MVDFKALNLGERYTRPQLAEIWGYKGYQALAKGVVTPKGSGVIMLFVTHLKQEALTQYRDYISGEYLYWEGEKGHANDDRVAFAHTRGEEIHLFFRDIHHTPFTYRGVIEIRRFVPHKERPSEFVFRIVHDLGPADDLATHSEELEPLSETERQVVTMARVGQGQFRTSLLDMWRGCAVTGVEEPTLLRASHIKPWRLSSNAERIDPHNGLLLLPQYDHLFDKGLITFLENGAMKCSEVLSAVPLNLLGIRMGDRLRVTVSSNMKYLEYHRDILFVRQTSID